MATTVYGKKILNLSEVRGKILQLFRDGPVLIGKVSSELRCSLAEAEGLLDELAYEKVIRLMNDSEKNAAGVNYGFVLNK